MRTSASRWLVAMMAGMVLFAAGCTNPSGGGEQAAGEDAGGGEGGEQVVAGGDESEAEAAGAAAEACEVQPPDLTLEDAVVGFSQMENNNPWRIAETESIQQTAEEMGV